MMILIASNWSWVESTEAGSAVRGAPSLGGTRVAPRVTDMDANAPPPPPIHLGRILEAGRVHGSGVTVCVGRTPRTPAPLVA